MNWTHAGIAEIGEENGSYRVRVPDRVWRGNENNEKEYDNIIKPGKYVDWYYNKASGILIITNDTLEKPDYEYADSNKFTTGNSEYKCTIPKTFFEDNEGVRATEIEAPHSDKIQLTPHGFLHFIYHDEMAEGRPKSCYVLTEKQFDKRFSDKDWDDGMDQTPKFFS